MRAVLTVCLVLGLATGAWAKPKAKPKSVNVVNFPTSQAVQVQNLPAPPLAPTKASQLVTLNLSGAECPGHPSARLFDRRVNADGTASSFTIPSGQVLIVTGLDWRQGLTTTNQEEVFVYQADGDGTLVDSLSVASTDQRAGANIQVSGVSVAAGRQLCFQVNSGNIGSADAVLHGFLAPDE